MSYSSKSYVNGIKHEPYAVTVATTATLAVGANSARFAVRFFNNHASATIYGGPSSGVTTSTGIPIPAQTAYEDTLSQDAWYFIVASGTADLRILVIEK